MEYYLSQNGVEFPGGTPPFARKWRAWRRNRFLASSKFRRRLTPFPGEPKPSDFRMPAGRMWFAEAHWLWFYRTFYANGKNKRLRMTGGDLLDCIELMGHDVPRKRYAPDAIATIAGLLAELRDADRPAPEPITWHEFYKRISRGYGRDAGPPLPRVLTSHWVSTSAQKHETLHDQLRWAVKHGRLGVALFYLRNLTIKD